MKNLDRYINVEEFKMPKAQSAELRTKKAF